jgi:hypothetical protein
MAKPILSKKTAHLLSTIVFLSGLVLLSYLKYIWPALLLLIGICLALKQYLIGKHFDMGVSLFVFLGAYITVQFDIHWQIALPSLFALGGIYLFIREFFLEPKIVSKEEVKEEPKV